MRFESNQLTGARMPERQSVCVKTEPVELRTAASCVADDWVADRLAVDAKLVSAAGNGFQFEQRSI